MAHTQTHTHNYAKSKQAKREWSKSNNQPSVKWKRVNQRHKKKAEKKKKKPRRKILVRLNINQKQMLT